MSPAWTTRWIALGLASFAAALVMMMSDREPERAADTDGPTSYSFKPTGYRLLRELLSELDFSVSTTRSSGPSRAGRGVLVLAEPSLRESHEPIEAIIRRSNTVLLILPKWQPAPPVPGRYSMMARGLVQEVLDEAGLDHVGVHRSSHIEWRDNDVGGPRPKVRGPFQLLGYEGVRPLVSTQAGVLLGRTTVGVATVYVLSDPDALANHGLARDANARFAVSLMKYCSRGGPIVFDETIHGLYRPPGLIDTMTEFPMIIIMIHGVLVAAVLVWLAGRRFGRPVSIPEGLEAGKRAMLDNVAELHTAIGGDDADSLRRYWRAAWVDVAETFTGQRHVQDPDETQRVLKRVARERGCDDPGDITRRVEEVATSRKRSATSILEVARVIRAWRKEMLDGPRRSS